MQTYDTVEDIRYRRFRECRIALSSLYNILQIYLLNRTLIENEPCINGFVYLLYNQVQAFHLVVLHSTL